MNKPKENLSGGEGAKISIPKPVAVYVNGLLAMETVDTNIEDDNFKIDSSDWRDLLIEGNTIIVNNVPVKINPEGDIWEITQEDGSIEQYFTWLAAMRELQKYGKSIPTQFQWKNIFQRDQDLKNQLPKVGCWDVRNFFSKGGGFYWALSSGVPKGHNICLTEDGDIFMPKDIHRAYGFPVRCIKTS